MGVDGFSAREFQATARQDQASLDTDDLFMIQVDGMLVEFLLDLESLTTRSIVIVVTLRSMALQLLSSCEGFVTGHALMIMLRSDV